MSDDRLAHAAPTVDTGQPAPPVTFTRVGVLGGDRLSFSGRGLGSSDVWRCERCKALVLAADCRDHLTYHTLLGLERWPDGDSGNLPDTEGSG